MIVFPFASKKVNLKPVRKCEHKWDVLRAGLTYETVGPTLTLVNGIAVECLNCKEREILPLRRSWINKEITNEQYKDAMRHCTNRLL